MSNNKENHDKDRIVQPNVCNTCTQILGRAEVVCWNCACCQKCKIMNNSRFRNFCYHCGYFLDQPTVDQIGNQITVHHHLHHKKSNP